MGEDPRSELRAMLGDAALAALEPLDDAEAEDLATIVRDAQARERRQLLEAAESSLGFVPRFARGAVKRIVFG